MRAPQMLRFVLLFIFLDFGNVIAQNSNIYKPVWTDCIQDETTKKVTFDTIFFSHSYTSNDTFYSVYVAGSKGIRSNKEIKVPIANNQVFFLFGLSTPLTIIDWSLKKRDTLKFEKVWSTFFILDTAYNSKIFDKSHRTQEGRIFLQKGSGYFRRIKIIEDVGIVISKDDNSIIDFIGYYNYHHLIYTIGWQYPKTSYFLDGSQKISFVNPNLCDQLSPIKIKDETEISFWPNPVDKILYLSASLPSNSYIQIFDVTGRFVHQLVVQEEQIDVS
jgi:hypothetical protein